MHLIVCLFLLLCTGQTRAVDQLDYALFGAAVVLHVVDLGQTLDIKNHDGVIETNPLLGNRPSKTKIYASCITKIGFDYLALRYLNPEWRRLFLTFDIGMTAQGTYSNSRVGVKVNF